MQTNAGCQKRAYDRCTLAIHWRWSVSALVSINEVNLRRVRLALGWVIVSGFNSRCGTFISVCNQPPRSISLTIPSWVGAMSTRQRAVTLCGWEVNAGMVRVWVAGEIVCYPCYRRAISERFRDRAIIKRYINSPSLRYCFFATTLQLQKQNHTISA